MFWISIETPSSKILNNISEENKINLNYNWELDSIKIIVNANNELLGYFNKLNLFLVINSKNEEKINDKIKKNITIKYKKWENFLKY